MRQPRTLASRPAGRRATQRHPARENHTASRGDDSSMPLTHTHIGEAHTDAATHPGGAWAGPPAFCPRAHACTLPRLRRRRGASRSPQSHARAVRRSLRHTHNTRPIVHQLSLAPPAAYPATAAHVAAPPTEPHTLAFSSWFSAGSRAQFGAAASAVFVASSLTVTPWRGHLLAFWFASYASRNWGPPTT